MKNSVLKYHIYDLDLFRTILGLHLRRNISHMKEYVIMGKQDGMRVWGQRESTYSFKVIKVSCFISFPSILLPSG